MKFEQHGIYAVEVKGKVMIVDATGPFNDELLKSYNDAVKRAVTHLSNAPWGQVIVLHGLSLFTPEAEQLLYESTVWRKEHNLQASAVILIDAQAEELIRSQMEKIYNRAGLEHQFYQDVDKAVAWLEEKF